MVCTLFFNQPTLIFASSEKASMQEAQEEYAAAKYKLIKNENLVLFATTTGKTSMNARIAFNINNGFPSNSAAIQADYEARVVKYAAGLEELQSKTHELSLKINADDRARINREQFQKIKLDNKDILSIEEDIESQYQSTRKSLIHNIILALENSIYINESK